MGGEDDSLGCSEHLEMFGSGGCMPVDWFAGSRGDRGVLFVARDTRMVSPGAKEVSPARDDIV